MKYNAQGMRIQKDDDTYTTNYFYNSQNQLSGIDVHGTVLYFYYDTDGNVTSFNHNGGTYYYIKNVQGDVIRIINDAGTTLVTYTYDAWGNITSQTDNTNYNLADVNPYKYRGYVYDYETGLYYLNSRYYDPVTGRFLNADIYCDTQSSILGTNMFTYCNNNPINQIDPEGTDAVWVQFPDAANGFGHTSLLVEDSSGCWWYFYWGPKHVILRPCGKDDFTLPELNSYLTGFDPRKNHNYYVHSYNGITYDGKINDLKNAETNDINRSIVKSIVKIEQEKNYKGEHGADYYFYKMYDGLATKSLYLKGDFQGSYDWLVSLMWGAFYATLNSDKPATQLFDDYYENGQRTYAYHICRKLFRFYSGQDIIHQGFEYFEEMETGNPINFGGYNLFFSNCVQTCLYSLTKGQFESMNIIKKYALYDTMGKAMPNLIYNNIWWLFKEEKMSNYL